MSDAVSHGRLTAPSGDVVQGLTLMVLSVLLSPLIDVFAKLAIVTVPSGEIAVIRFAVQVAFILPIVLLRGTLLDLSWKRMGLHALRGALVAITNLAFITTLKVMQVADAIAIFFVEPIILTVLGGIFLKETIGWRRYTACVVGFAGAMLVIQPSLEEVGAIALLPVVAAASLAVFMLLTRMTAQREDPWSMQFYAGVWATLFTGLALWAGTGSGSPIFDPVVPDARAWVYLLATGVVATISGILSVYACRMAPASTLAPLQYLEIVSATIFGFLVFDHLPDPIKWLGIAIIVASGLFIIWRERQVERRAIPTPP